MSKNTKLGPEMPKDIETVLTLGMVLFINPMELSRPEGMEGAGGYHEHDILVVGESSAENITRFPIGPKHKVYQCRS